MLEKQVLAIIGHSGAGKTLLSTELSRRNNYPLLVCSELGRKLGREKYNCQSFRQCFDLPNVNQYINDFSEYIVYSVVNKFADVNESTLIFDDLILFDAIQLLKAKGIDVKIYLLDVPYKIRIERIMERQDYTCQEAVDEEYKKVLTKKRLGIDDVIKSVDYVLDGSKPMVEILGVFPLPTHS